jgi:hypothetical protein
MPTMDDRNRPTAGVRTYVSDVLPRIQNLLSILADIDFTYECDLDVVRASAAIEDLKTVAIRRLQQLHDRNRAPILRELMALEERLRA